MRSDAGAALTLSWLLLALGHLGHHPLGSVHNACPVQSCKIPDRSCIILHQWP